MRRQTLRVLGTLLGLAPAVVAWTPARMGTGTALTLAPQSRLWIDGNSTVRRFTCKATSLQTDVQTAEGDAVAAVLAGQKAVRAVTVTVPSERLECGNGTMNEHMFKALKVKEHKAVAFTLVSYDVAKGADGVRGTLTGTLTLGGVQRTISVPAQARPEANGALRVTGAHELQMTEYGLKAPTLMMGTLKVDPKVTVHFDLLLQG